MCENNSEQTRLGLPDEGYYRNASCALNLISPFFKTFLVPRTDEFKCKDSMNIIIPHSYNKIKT
jgi:hypothetical protein